MARVSQGVLSATVGASKKYFTAANDKERQEIWLKLVVVASTLLLLSLLVLDIEHIPSNFSSCNSKTSLTTFMGLLNPLFSDQSNSYRIDPSAPPTDGFNATLLTVASWNARRRIDPARAGSLFWRI